MNAVMRVRGWIVVAMLATVGCATSPSGAARMPVEPPSPAGTWVGAFMGADLASAAGVLEPPARLTIGADGRWTLTSSGGAVATGWSRRVDNTIELDGTMTAGDPMAVGRAVSYTVAPRDTALRRVS